MENSLLDDDSDILFEGLDFQLFSEYEFLLDIDSDDDIQQIELLMEFDS